MPSDSAPEIFDPARRKAQQQRAIGLAKANHFIWDILSEDIADRLGCTTRKFESCLITGPLSGYAEKILGPNVARYTQFNFACEDQLGVEPESFDLVISAGTLDSVNDLPGALIQIRRALRPDGLFLGAMFGAGTLASLKKALLLADGATATSHIHPQIELRAAADLLTRAGFALPVADRMVTKVRYRDWRSLVDDLRSAGVGNCLAGKRPYLGKKYLNRLDDAWEELAASDGKVSECFEFLHLSGWRPSANQPKPARRGSGEISLSAILGKSN